MSAAERMKHIFIRHPPLTDMQGICYGALDVHIADAVVMQYADKLKKELPLLPVISSPLQRCFALAQTIDINAKQDSRLIEMNFGDWQGRPWDCIDRLALDAWAKDVTKFRAPNGENFIDVIARLSDFLHQLEVPHILVTHAGVIRAAHYLLGAVPTEQAAAMEIPYAAPIIIRA
jgi:alpha-ribazole phosphatase